MTAFSSANLHTDAENIRTSASHGDPGDGTTNWFNIMRVLDGGDVAQGDRSDAASIDPTAASTIISLLKGLLNSVRALTNSTSTAQENDRVVKATPGTLYALRVYNNNAGAQWIQLHNVTSVPADAVVPVLTFAVPAQSNLVIDFGTNGRIFSTGIYVCNSTTDVTKTLGADDCLFDLQYL